MSGGGNSAVTSSFVLHVVPADVAAPALTRCQGVLVKAVPRVAANDVAHVACAERAASFVQSFILVVGRVADLELAVFFSL